jgi:hypothetical protein
VYKVTELAKRAAEQDIKERIGFIRNEMTQACPSVRPNDREWILALIVTEVEGAYKAASAGVRELTAKLAEAQEQATSINSELFEEKKQRSKAENLLAFERQKQSEGYKVPALEEQVRELTEALEKYGRHLQWSEKQPIQCHYDPDGVKYYPNDPKYRCDCGFAEVMARIKGDRECLNCIAGECAGKHY